MREAYDITSLDSFFPEQQPEFRQTISQLVPQLCRLSLRLLKCLAIALGNKTNFITTCELNNKCYQFIGLEGDFFTRCHTMMCQGSDKNATTFRSLFYPSLADSAVTAGVERCGKHSDYGTFTLLFQDDIGGLEVKFYTFFFPISIKTYILHIRFYPEVNG